MNCYSPSRFKDFFDSVLCEDLLLKTCISNCHQLNQLEKVVLSSTASQASKSPTFNVPVLTGLEFIGGQTPRLTRATKSIAQFQIRRHQLLGATVTLRNRRVFQFLDVITSIVVPRWRNVEATSASKRWSLKKTSAVGPSKTMSDNCVALGTSQLQLFPECEPHTELLSPSLVKGFTMSLQGKKTAKNFRLLLGGLQWPLV